MITPCVVRAKDTPLHAVREMRMAGVSSAYVVDSHMRFLGVVGIEAAIGALRANALTLDGLYETELAAVTADTVVNDILPLAAAARYPIPVLEADGSLKGIVSKASVLSSLI